MKAVRYTSYPSAPAVKDPVFIFCNSTQKGALTAISPGGTGPFNFSWYKWNDATKSFSDLLLVETGSTSSLVNIDEGGYRVIITGSITTTLTGWIFFDKPPVAGASLQQQLCERVAIKGDTAATVQRFSYRDINTGSVLSLKNEISFLWTSSPSTFIPSPGYELNPIIVNIPPPGRVYRLPLEDVTFKLRVNSLGCSSEASFFYQSIHVKAEFTADPVDGEAPLDVTFTDKSVRGTYKYRWNFGEKTPDGKKASDWVVNKDSLWIFSSPFNHTYYRPGEYSASLTVESDLHCIDSFRLEKKINVEKSKLEIPNVFSPDGDGLNDNFRVESKSLRWISMKVFSRSGIKVYDFLGEGEILRQWQGWDGNVRETSTKASPGVYFYIIRARGWDDIDYNTKEQRGYVYLYR